MDRTLLTSQSIPLRNGETIYVNVMGKGSKILVFVHGMITDHRCFSPLFKYLEEDFTLLGIDLRGQGKSTFVNVPVSVDCYVEDISLILEHYQVKRCSIVAWSIGGVMASRFAMLYPDMVENLFLIGPPTLSGCPLFSFNKIDDVNSSDKAPKKLLTKKEELLDIPYVKEQLRVLREQDLDVAKKMVYNDCIDPFHIDPEMLESLGNQLLLSKSIVEIRWAFSKFNYYEEEKWGNPGSGDARKMKAKIYIFYGTKDKVIRRFVLEEWMRELREQVILIELEAGHGVQFVKPKEICETILKAEGIMKEKTEESI